MVEKEVKETAAEANKRQLIEKLGSAENLNEIKQVLIEFIKG